MRLRLAAAVSSAIPGAPGVRGWLPTSLVAGTVKLPGQRPGRGAIHGQPEATHPEKIHNHPSPGPLITRSHPRN